MTRRDHTDRITASEVDVSVNIVTPSFTRDVIYRMINVSTENEKEVNFA